VTVTDRGFIQSAAPNDGGQETPHLLQPPRLVTTADWNEGVDGLRDAFFMIEEVLMLGFETHAPVSNVY
jgi:hypothetical protein